MYKIDLRRRCRSGATWAILLGQVVMPIIQAVILFAFTNYNIATFPRPRAYIICCHMYGHTSLRTCSLGLKKNSQVFCVRFEYLDSSGSLRS